MRRRMGMAGSTGLGNPAPHRLVNNWPTTSVRQHSLVRRCLKSAVDEFFTRKYEWGIDAWCDFSIGDDELRIGQEPSYMYEHLKIVCISRDKTRSYIECGVAWGPWGSSIASNRRYYADYKYKSKFVRFIDRWHPLLFPDGGDDE